MVNSKSRVFLFTGNGGYLKEKAIEDLKSSLLGSSSSELNYKMFYGGETDAKEILGYVTTIPFLAAKRFVVVKYFEKLSQEDKDILIKYLKNPSESTCLVLETSDDNVLKEYVDIASHANICHFKDPAGAELTSWMNRFLFASGKKIEEEAIEVLKEMQGNNLLSLAQELEKLIVFIGERDTIKVSDVEEVVAKSLVSSVFDLTDAIEGKQVDRSVKIISDLIMGGKKPYEIIGLLCWHLKRILRAKDLQAKGEPDLHVAGILKIGKKHSDEFFKQANRLTVGQIRSKMRIILEADLDIKRSKYDPALILEFAVIKLCLG